MYGATELAKMFKTTRSTIYSKLNAEELQQHITKTKTGKKLSKEGLSILQLLMSNSKICIDTQQLDNQTDNKYTSELVNNLYSQIEELKKDKERLLVQVNEQKDTINFTKNLFLESKETIKLLEGQTKEREEHGNKKWWKFWN